MKNMKAILLRTALTTLVCCAVTATAVAATDVITVPAVNSGISPTVDVPIYIRDVSGTPLGIDQPPGSRIQSYSIKVDYAPAAAVQSVSIARAGITQALTPTFESKPTSPGSVSLLDTFQESTNLIPFTSNAAAPGNQVAHLIVQLSPSAVVGSTVTLTLDPTLTQLADQGGVITETVNNGALSLVNGSILVTTSIPAMNEWALALLVLALAGIAVRMRM